MQPLRLNLDFKAVILWLTVGVLMPVMLSTAAGIVAIVFADDAGGIVTGVLIICFTAAAAGSALVAVVIMARKARLARLQSDFIANVTHEFRTPLSNIRLHTQTLQSGIVAGNNELTAECLSTILRETEWLDTMLDKVLTWRASAGDMLPLEPVIQPVSQAVNEAVERFQSMVPAGEVTLSVIGCSRLDVRHDIKALNSVLLNLLTNAYKNTGNNKRIEISLRDDQDVVVIAVRDNGLGLSHVNTESIFEPFHRNPHPAGSDSSGVGLGLAIARYIVHRHGGAIQAANAKTQGAIFTIRLPACKGTS